MEHPVCDKIFNLENCKREIIKYRENKIEFRLFVKDPIGG